MVRLGSNSRGGSRAWRSTHPTAAGAVNCTETLFQRYCIAWAYQVRLRAGELVGPAKVSAASHIVPSGGTSSVRRLAASSMHVDITRTFAPLYRCGPYGLTQPPAPPGRPSAAILYRASTQGNAPWRPLLLLGAAIAMPSGRR